MAVDLLAPDDLITLPDERAADLAGVTDRQLRYWETTDLIVPSVRRSFSLRRNVRLYRFTDLMSLLVAAELRTRSFSVQHIRKVVRHLQSRGYPEPLHQLVFATAGKSIFFQHPDGSWEDDVRADQLVLIETIQLEPIRARIRAAVRRPASSYGHIESHRGRMGSKPVFAGTRIPVENIRRRLEHGFSEREIIEAFPDLTRKDIKAALGYHESA